MAQPEGFTWTRRKSGDVVIDHHGRQVTILRGAKATRFFDDVADAENAQAQELMARVTGNYKRGNERHARQHPRNRR